MTTPITADAMHAVHQARRELLAEVAVASAVDVPRIVENSPILSVAEVRDLTNAANEKVNTRLEQMAEQRRQRAEQVSERLDELEAEADRINEELRNLPAAAKAGRVGFTEYQKTYADLTARKQRIARVAQETVATGERIAAEEADPVAAMQALERKYPHLRTTVSGYLLRLGEHDPVPGPAWSRTPGQ